MAPKLNIHERVFEFLRSHPEERFTSRAIADRIFKQYPDECAEKRKKSSQEFRSDEEFLGQLTAEIAVYHRLIKKYPQVRLTEGRPRKLYFSEKSEADEAEAVEIPIPSTVPGLDRSKSENDLYPKLCQFLYGELQVRAKRIDEKTSSNRYGKSGNHWIHPDVVGLEDLASDWDPSVRDCVGKTSDKRARLWSFEVKLLVNRANLRECFFQAVSNSSWANFGYLVADEIIGQGTLEELRMLSAAHGIGLIRLDFENPSDSQIIIPASERRDVNWGAASRLSSENGSFKGFLQIVRRFHENGEINENDWHELRGATGENGTHRVKSRRG
jgi:hypothetical protein